MGKLSGVRVENRVPKFKPSIQLSIISPISQVFRKPAALQVMDRHHPCFASQLLL